MKIRSLSVLLLGAALAACAQEPQSLPFSLEGEAGVTRAVPAEGALITNPAGASVQLPAGALRAGTEVTLAKVAPPTSAGQSGTAASAAFRLEPEGAQLSQRARVELRFERTRPDAWLASVVNFTPEGVRELGDTRVDLTTGLVQTGISQLGTLAVVIPAEGAVFRASRSPNRSLARSASPPLAPTGTDSVRADCGDPENRCSGLTVSASDNLLARVDDAAVVYPRLTGALRIDGATASGRLELDAAFRARLQSGATAENVVIHARIVPTAATTVTETASEIVFSNLRYSVSGSVDGGSAAHEYTDSLRISKAGEVAPITVSRSFPLRTETGALEDASVSVTFPVTIHQ